MHNFYSALQFSANLAPQVRNTILVKEGGPETLCNTESLQWPLAKINKALTRKLALLPRIATSGRRKGGWGWGGRL